jgi:SulP family sulfate permease
MFKPKFFTTIKEYSLAQFYKDLVSGIIVAIIALPLSIALATASGVAPEKGLYTAIIAGFIISFLGGSRVQIGGPTGAFMVIVYGIVYEYGVDGLIVATFMAGVIMILLGLLKVGNMIKYIPYTITTGFTSGIALVIFSSQIKDFLGLEIDVVPSEFIGKWESYLKNLSSFSMETFVIGAIALAILILWPKVTRKIPAAFVALIVTSLITWGLGLDVITIGTRFGALASQLPVPKMPVMSLELMKKLIGPAISIALLGSIESLLSAVVADGMIGGKHRSNMELVAQGIANMASALFGGIPATGAIARTAANIENGGRTPVAGMVHSITLLIILMVFMPLVSFVPMTSLAAVLMMVAYNMSEMHIFMQLLKSQKGDVIVLLATFVLTVFIDLVVAIEFGMIMSAFIFMKRIVEASNIEERDLLDVAEEVNENVDGIASIYKKKHKNVQIYKLSGPFFFGTANNLLDTIQQIHVHTEYLILDMKEVQIIDSTAINSLKMLKKRCDKLDIVLVITQGDDRIVDEMKKTLIFERPVMYYESLKDTVNQLENTFNEYHQEKIKA